MATPKPTGLVLAGGQSRRFGSDKASALLQGRPLLDWVVSALLPLCDEVVVVAAQAQPLPALGSTSPVRVARDEHQALGPLAGLVTGLSAASNDICLALSCDAPLIQPTLLAHLLELLGDHAAVVPQVDGRLQPLVAAYRAGSCLPPFRARVQRGELGLIAALEGLDVCVVDDADLRPFDADLRSFKGINTPADLASVEQLVDNSPLP